MKFFKNLLGRKPIFERAEQAIAEKDLDALFLIAGELVTLDRRHGGEREYYAKPLIVIGDRLAEDPRFFSRAFSVYTDALSVAYAQGDVQQEAVERIRTLAPKLPELSDRLDALKTAAYFVRPQYLLSCEGSREAQIFEELKESVSLLPSLLEQQSRWRSFRNSYRMPEGSYSGWKSAVELEILDRKTADSTLDRAAAKKFVWKYDPSTAECK